MQFLFALFIFYGLLRGLDVVSKSYVMYSDAVGLFSAIYFIVWFSFFRRQGCSFNKSMRIYLCVLAPFVLIPVLTDAGMFAFVMVASVYIGIFSWFLDKKPKSPLCR
jgi:hypothetical protein